MAQYLLIAKTSDNKPLTIVSNMANRHGLIAGATGTGKTVTLQKIAESFSSIGVPVFMADVKGDLSGVGAAGTLSEKLKHRLDTLHIDDWTPKGFPVIFWDVFGKQGHPIRATVSDIGPLLLSRLLGLNDVQMGVLQIVFKVADDNHLLLLDLKDLRAMIQYVSDNAAQLKTQYGNVSNSSIGAILRGLLTLEEQGGDLFLGEPMLDINDLMLVNKQGKGIINILAANNLYNLPTLYSTVLLWLLSELYEKSPEVGDLDKPKLVFFFDEAHLLFNNSNTVLVDRLEQMVRLIRSKGIGIYFVTQNPSDIPDRILSQLGNRVQHALRAFSARDQKAVKAAAQTMRANPNLDTEQVIQELAVGEALVSLLDDNGIPSIVEKANIIAPCSRMGTLSNTELTTLMTQSPLRDKYEQTIDRESAFEILKQAATQTIQRNTTKQSPASLPKQAQNKSDAGLWRRFTDFLFGKTGPRGGHQQGLLEKTSKQLTKQIIRGLLDNIKNKR